MFRSPFYHSVTRKLTTVFGTLFNEISIQLRDDTGAVVQTIRVPIAYGTAEKWLTRLRQENSIDSTEEGYTRVKMTLPRMAFTFNGFSYDAGRQLNRANKQIQCGIPKTETQTAAASQTVFTLTQFEPNEFTYIRVNGVHTEPTNYVIDSVAKTVTFNNPFVGGEVITFAEGSKLYEYQRVPYNFEFELSIIANKTEDALKIVEQIVPFFDPQLVVSVKMNSDLNINEDVPFLLDSVQFDDNYEGELQEQREIVWTLTFTAQSYLYKPTVESKIILNIDDLTGDTAGEFSQNLIVWNDDNQPPGC